jgi:hypothetical protein
MNSYNNNSNIPEKSNFFQAFSSMSMTGGGVGGSNDQDMEYNPFQSKSPLIITCGATIPSNRSRGNKQQQQQQLKEDKQKANQESKSVNRISSFSMVFSLRQKCAHVSLFVPVIYSTTILLRFLIVASRMSLSAITGWRSRETNFASTNQHMNSKQLSRVLRLPCAAAAAVVVVYDPHF